MDKAAKSRGQQAQGGGAQVDKTDKGRAEEEVAEEEGRGAPCEPGGKKKRKGDKAKKGKEEEGAGRGGEEGVVGVEVTEEGVVGVEVTEEPRKSQKRAVSEGGLLAGGKKKKGKGSKAAAVG